MLNGMPIKHLMAVEVWSCQASIYIYIWDFTLFQNLVLFFSENRTIREELSIMK